MFIEIEQKMAQKRRSRGIKKHGILSNYLLNTDIKFLNSKSCDVTATPFQASWYSISINIPLLTELNVAKISDIMLFLLPLF